MLLLWLVVVKRDAGCRDGGVARMSDPGMVKAIKEAVTIPVMAKARIGHFVEAQVLEACSIDYIDESEVLTPADEIHHINKHNFKIPFVCGCRDLGEALRRMAEGASMIRTKGEAGTGNVVEAVRHCRAVQGAIRCAAALISLLKHHTSLRAAACNKHGICTQSMRHLHAFILLAVFALQHLCLPVCLQAGQLMRSAAIFCAIVFVAMTLQHHVWQAIHSVHVCAKAVQAAGDA